MENTTPQSKDSAADANFIRIVLSHCLSLVPAAEETTSNVAETLLHIRKLMRLADYYMSHGEGALPDSDVEEIESSLRSGCLSCAKCMADYSNINSQWYHDMDHLNVCLACPCT